MNEKIKVGSIVEWLGATSPNPPQAFDCGVVLKVNSIRGRGVCSIRWFVDKFTGHVVPHKFLKVLVP